MKTKKYIFIVAPEKIYDFIKLNFNLPEDTRFFDMCVNPECDSVYFFIESDEFDEYEMDERNPYQRLNTDNEGTTA